MICFPSLALGGGGVGVTLTQYVLRFVCVFNIYRVLSMAGTQRWMYNSLFGEARLFLLQEAPVVSPEYIALRDYKRCYPHSETVIGTANYFICCGH